MEKHDLLAASLATQRLSLSDWHLDRPFQQQSGAPRIIIG